MKVYVQYGCGASSPEEWLNFDASPTLRIQKNAILDLLTKKYQLYERFGKNVKYGDITKGLPLKPDSCDAIYCSHVLEHLSLTDFRKALCNTYHILKPGGVFRLVMPDLETIVNQYLLNKKTNPLASIDFIKDTYMGSENRKKGFLELLKSVYGNSKHLWLWDYDSTMYELKSAGFKDIRKCQFNDSDIAEFQLVENKDRFIAAIAIEAKK
jgi:predicted SAM-dependent methyltransferase